MKRKEPSADKPRRGFNPDKFRRHYVSAVESDDASITEEEKGNLGRIFTFLLLLHVFLIGAVVLYNLIAEKPKPEFSSVAGVKAKDASTITPVEVAAQTDHEGMDEYFVISGQSLQDISDATGASQEQIITLNHLDENGELFVGRKLLVPKRKPAVVAATPVTESQAQQMAAATQATTTKAGGESFTAVDPSRSSSADSLPKEFVAKTMNNVQDKLPESKPKDAKPAASVTPKPRDPEPKTVAKTTPPPAPKKETMTKPKETAPAKTVAKKGGTHEVKPRETFYSIARRYGVNVNDLMKANGIKDASTLRDGTKLKIPSNG